jgi:U4/U6 small nuclear ribonucleoprotein PRP3
METNGSKRPAEDSTAAQPPAKRRSRFSEAAPAAGKSPADIAAAAAALTARINAQTATQFTAAAAAPAAVDKAAQIAALQAAIKAQIANAALAGPTAAAAAAAPPAAAAVTKKARDFTLRLDEQGRQIDEAGRLVRTGGQPVATVKANLDAQRRSNNPYLAHMAHRAAELDPNDPSYVDPKVAARAAAARPKRAGFSFVAEGTYVKQAEKEREKELVKEHRKLLRGHVAKASSSGSAAADSAAAARPKRAGFSFVAEGTYVKQAEKEREKELVKEHRKLLRGHVAKASSSGGAAADSAAAAVAPTAMAAAAAAAADSSTGTTAQQRQQQAAFPLPRDHGRAVPAVEWWDEPFLPDDDSTDSSASTTTAAAGAAVAAANGTADSMDVDSDSTTAVTAAAAVAAPQGQYARAQLEACATYKLVQHPPAVAAAGGAAALAEPAPATIHLTKTERKRVRRQARGEREREKQDKMALGLLPPPPVKMKLSNFMRVLGEQAVADPSKVEKMVQQQVQVRTTTAAMYHAHYIQYCILCLVSTLIT